MEGHVHRQPISDRHHRFSMNHIPTFQQQKNTYLSRLPLMLTAVTVAFVDFEREADFASLVRLEKKQEWKQQNFT